MRNYGLPNAEPQGIPVATPLEKPTTCPNCGCAQVMDIMLPVKQDLIRGKKGLGRYMGCPACPWASPMIVTSNTPERSK